jgi:FKBP-type peptidyl-prolyl cis-trans isomerase
MKTFIASFLAALFFLQCNAQVTPTDTGHSNQNEQTGQTFRTLLDSTSYAFGMNLYIDQRTMLDKYLKAKGIKTLNFTAFNQAIVDGLHKNNTGRQSKATSNPPKYLHGSHLDSLSYSLGVNLLVRFDNKLTADLKARNIDSINYGLLNQAIIDALANKRSALTRVQSITVITKNIKPKYVANISRSNEFLLSNKAKPGVVTLPSGLQYTILTEGIGTKVKFIDSVTTDYTGRLLNGQKFDSSFDHKKPLYLTSLSAVIPGWAEGLQLMNKGAKYRFFIPYQLAYGDWEGNPAIPPYSVLIFDIEVLKIGKQ